MKRTELKKIFDNAQQFGNQTVTVCGWVRTIRDSKVFGFMEINDGSFFKNVQVVFDNTLENFNEICKYTISSSV